MTRRLSSRFPSVDGTVWAGSKYKMILRILSSASFRSICCCTLHELTSGDRVFLAEARLILSKMVWNFELEMVDADDWNWLDQKAYLVFEPKALMVKLEEKALA